MKNQLIFLTISSFIHAVTYNWEITYVNVNPAGTPRRAIGVNGVWPPPPLEANLNDTFIVNVKNSLDVPTALHSHGLFQNGTSFFDGATGVTQCPIPPGANFTYTIPIKQH
ncbi:ferroxidase fet3, partial [Lobulomyces angularis]